MPNKTIYLPEELTQQMQVLGLDLNVSALVQDLLRQKLEEATHCCSRCGQTLPGRG